MRRIPCVGAVITAPGHRILLVKRGHEPETGRWSLPGGRIEPGESDQQALVREVREETGLEVTPGGLIGSVERPGPGGTVLDIRDYAATVTGGLLAAGDDAAGACWASPAELAGLPLTSGLAVALTAWGVLGAAAAPGLAAEATRRAGVLWLAVPGQDRQQAAWHVWAGGSAYVVTGPGEQPLHGLAGARLAGVSVTAGDSSQVVTWQARVHRVSPRSAEWDAVVGQLVAGRLNAVVAAGETSPAQRWARSGAVYCLTPVAAGGPAA